MRQCLKILRSRWPVAAGVALILFLVPTGCRQPEQGGIAGAPTQVAKGRPPAAPRVKANPNDHGWEVEPDKPSGFSVANNGLREVSISWSAPSDKPYRYRIERSDSRQGPFEVVGNEVPVQCNYVDRGEGKEPLKDSTTYYYRMVGTSYGGKLGTPSEVLSSTTAAPPDPPTNVQATAPSSRAVKITWTPSASEGVTGYRVERMLATGPYGFTTLKEVPGTEYLDGGTTSTDLQDSSKYLYRVITINRVDAVSSPSRSAGVTTLPPPAAVRRVQALGNEVRCVPLFWDASPEEDVARYEVCRSSTVTGEFAVIGSVYGRSTTNYLDGGKNPGNLEDEGTYYYRVRAINNVNSQSPDSEIAKAVTRAVPPEIQGVTCESNHPREVAVSWQVSPDNSVNGYEIWRAGGGEDDYALVTRSAGRDIARFLDRGTAKRPTGLGSLKDGTVYRYRVIAYNSANVRSPASVPAEACTKFCPGTPQGVVATTNLPHAVHLVWKGNAEKDILEYAVEVAEKPNGSFRRLPAVAARDAGADLAMDDSNLGNGLMRYYHVKALDRDGLESEWSSIAPGRTKPLPDAPKNLQTQSRDDGVLLSWDPPAQGDVTKYGIWLKRMFFQWDFVATTEKPQHLFVPADLAKPITVSVTAVDKDGLESERSDSREVKP